MEAQLKQAGFDPKEWLEMNLKQSNLSNIELNLTELVYNLQLIQQQNEESILNAQQQLGQQSDQIFAQGDKVYGQFEQIGQLINSSLNEQSLEKLSLNDKLSQELEEMTFAKNRLNYAIEQLDNILKLEFYEEEIGSQIEENNTAQIEKLVRQIHQTLRIMEEFPDNRQYSDISKRIRGSVVEYVLKQIGTKFDTDTHSMHKDFFAFYSIMKLFDQQQQLVALYREKRLAAYVAQDLQNKFGQFIGGQVVTSLELEKIVEIALGLLSAEYGYIVDQKQKFDREIAQQLVEAYISDLYQFLVGHFFSKIFFENYSINKVLVMHQTWLSLIFQVLKFCEQNNFTPAASANIAQILFKPYTNSQTPMFQCECHHINEQLAEKAAAATDNISTLSKDHLLEALQEFDIISVAGIIQSSFQRVLEVSFGVQLEEWLRLVKEIVFHRLSYVDQLVAELERQNYQEPLLDRVVEFKHIKKNYLAAQETDASTPTLEKCTLSLKSSLPILELLIQKVEDLLIFDHLLNKVDKVLRSSIQQNAPAYYGDVSRQIQQFLLASNMKLQISRNSILLNISNGNSLFEECYVGIQALVDRIKKVGLKLLLSDHVNELAAFQAQMQENSFASFTAAVQSISQNFTTQMQMLEQIRQAIRINSKSTDCLPGSQQEQQETLEALYAFSLSKEIYLQNILNYQAAAKPGKQKNEFIRFWSTIAAYFISKILVVFLQKVKSTTGAASISALKAGLQSYQSSMAPYSYQNEVSDYLKETISSCQKNTEKLQLVQMISL